jgi:spore coat protein U-like protein
MKTRKSNSLTAAGWVAVVGVAMLLTASAAVAAPLTGTFQVKTNVVDSCNTLTTNDIDFGVYDPFAVSVLNGSATFQFFCTKGTSFTSVDMSGVVGARTMSNGTDTIAYELYQPSGDGAAATCPNTTTWGAGTPVGAGKGYKPANAASKVVATVLRVCGTTTQGANVSAGAYSNTVTITINYL